MEEKIDKIRELLRQAEYEMTLKNISEKKEFTEYYKGYIHGLRSAMKIFTEK